MPKLDERARRLTVAADAQTLGYGGISFIQKASGISRKTIRSGVQELAARDLRHTGRIRRPGGGRKPLAVTDHTIKSDLAKLVDPYIRGDPMSPLRYVSKSSRKLAQALAGQGHSIGHMSVRKLLIQTGYTLQSNVKSKEMVTFKDRDQQFETINETAIDFLAAGDPVISVDGPVAQLPPIHYCFPM